MKKKFPHHKKWGVSFIVTLLLLVLVPSFAQAQNTNSWILPVKEDAGYWWFSGYYREQYGGRVKTREVFHTGVDLAVYNTPVYASHSGTVVVSEDYWQTFYGIAVFIHDPLTGDYSFYAHLSSSNVFVGQEVLQGQQIGLSGCMAGGEECHLHWGRSTVEPSWFSTFEQHAQNYDGKGWADPLTYVNGSEGEYFDFEGNSQTVDYKKGVFPEMPVSDRALSFVPQQTAIPPPQQEVNSPEIETINEDEYITVVIDTSALTELNISSNTVIIAMGLAVLAILFILIIYYATRRY